MQARSNASESFGAAAGYTDTGIVFENSYLPVEDQLTLEAQKVLTGRKPEAGEFSFVVMDGQTVISTGTNADNGTVTFRPITYSKVGTYHYMIREVDGGLHGVTYSDAVYYLVVTVVNDNGRLVATPAYYSDAAHTQAIDQDDLVFNNRFTPDEESLVLEATKTLTNLTGDSQFNLKAGQFSFVVKDEGGNIVATGTNDANGAVKFSAIDYALSDLTFNNGVYEPRTFVYKVSELIPDATAKDVNMTYDTQEYTVRVTVSYDAQNGELIVGTPVIDNAGAMVFTNIQYPATVSVTPQAFKHTYSDMATQNTANVPDVSFSFEITDAAGAVVGRGVGSANPDPSGDPNVVFSQLTFGNSDVGQTYTYWIKETHSGTINGITHDAAKYKMEVTISRTSGGQLEATVSYFKEDGTPITGNFPAFTNGYEAKGYLNVVAHKKLNGGTGFNGKTFAFELQQINDQNEPIGIVIEGVSDANGDIHFGTLYYDESWFAAGDTEKTVRYRMKEVVPASGGYPGVTYDTQSSFILEVTLTHDQLGGINPAVMKILDETGATVDFIPTGNAVDATGAIFENQYAPIEGATATIEAKKTLTGRDMRTGEFSFGLYLVGTDPQGNPVEILVDTANNAEDADKDGIADVVFTVVYPAETPLGDYSYIVREINKGLGGVQYDDSEYGVTITITDPQDGTLDAQVSYPDGEIRFTNKYEAAGTQYVPVAKKVLNNRDIVKGEFSFIITDDGGNVVSTGTNDEHGNVVFSPIGYEPGAQNMGPYEYTVSEVKGNLKGVEYTGKVYKLRVTVTDPGTGKLETTGAYTDAQYTTPVDAEFVNTYTPDLIPVRLEATKEITGRELVDGEFSFVVTDDAGNVKAVGNNDANGVIRFTDIGYALDNDLLNAGSKEFKYIIREAATTQGGVTVVAGVYYAKVIVTYNTQTGRLSASVKYYSDPAYANEILASQVKFVNEYNPAQTAVQIVADKTLINKDLQAGEFTFILKDASGATLQEKPNAADGSVFFDAVPFAQPGRYIYTVSERVTDQTKADRYTLDDPFTVIITVTDDLQGNLVATATYHVMDASGNYDASADVGGIEFINRYTAPAITKDLSVAIDATKTVTTPNGITYSPAGFEFQVVDIKNTLIATGVSDANGKIAFQSFTFERAGEYHYWVYEKDTNKGGITKDTRAWEIHILVRYNQQSGLLYIQDSDVQTYLVGRTANDSNSPDFVNVYAPAPAKLYLTATKQLEGRPLQDREFLFYLMEGNQIAAQAYNSVDGTVKFEVIYTQIGTHTYKIVEHKGSLGGVTYDTTAYNTLTVEVRDNGNGQLVAYVGGEAMSNGASVATGKTITNRYHANAAEAYVVAHKQLLGGRVMKAGDFTFELKNKNDPNEVYTAKNTADGHIDFAVRFHKAGTYVYTLREVKGSDPSITYDEKVYEVTVTVTDDAKGQLHAQVSYNTEDGHTPVFENIYKALPVTAEIKAHKTLVGEKALAAGQYRFELEGEGVKITDVTNDAKGNVVFHVKLDAVGEYTYIIRETKGAELGTTYDATEFKVKVVVTDNLNGNLVAQVIYPDVEDGKLPSFTNSYKGEKVPVKVTAGKKLTDKKLVGNDFTFQLVNKLDPSKVLTAKNDASGNVVFDLTFENSGVYIYTLSEVTGTDANITYDQNSYTVTITVVDDLKGYLTAKVEYSTADGAAPVFQNAYTPNAIGLTLEGTKKLTGKDLEKDEFSFQVRDGQGNLVATGKNDADGKIVFTEIKLGVAGKYTFTVTEVKGRNVSITYDETVFTVSVTVVNEDGTLKAEAAYPENGIVFENVYEKLDPENPDTGDHSGLAMYATVMAVSLIGVAVLLVVMKKRSRQTK